MVKLYAFALLLGLIVVASAQEETCVDTREGCDAARCGLFQRIECPKTCNACDGYENKYAGQHNAAVYEGNHITTWDRLPYDVTNTGEFILLTNNRTGMNVHALFTRKEGVRNSVTTAISAVGGAGQEALQVALDPVASQNITRTSSCKMIYWYGDQRLENSQVEKRGGYAGMAKVEESYERNAWKIELRSEGDYGTRIVLSVRHQPARGCYFDKVEMMVTKEQIKDSRGLFGTPDNNLYNEWHRRNGSAWSLPNREGRYLEPAYDYARLNWCVDSSADSQIQYEGLGTFDEHMKCEEPYDGFASFASATDNMKAVCGAHNYECLHDSISIPSETDGKWTNRMQSFVQSSTTPPFRGLNAEPRGIQANNATMVRITITLDKKVKWLNGFGLAELDENLQKTGKIISFISDDGNSANGDTDQFDGVYTKLIPHELGNGISKGYYVVPLIKGVYHHERTDDDIIFALPDAVRGFSRSSGRHNLGGIDRYFERTNLRGTFIEVSFIWPEHQPYVEVAATFLNRTVGTFCGPNKRFMRCECSRVGDGSYKKVTVELSKAFRVAEDEFRTSTSIDLYGIWSNEGSGPIQITVIAKNEGSGKAMSGTFLTMEVTPQQKENTKCANQGENQRNLLGRLNIVKRNARTWRFSLEPEQRS